MRDRGSFVPGATARLSQIRIEAQRSVDSRQRSAILTLCLCRPFLSVALSHGCRQVSKLLGGKGDEVVEKVWRMWVSDRRSFSFPGVPDRCSSFCLSMTCQSRLVLRTTTRDFSGDPMLTGIWMPVDRVPEDLVEDDSQVLVCVFSGSSPIHGNQRFRQTIQ